MKTLANICYMSLKSSQMQNGARSFSEFVLYLWVGMGSKRSGGILNRSIAINGLLGIYSRFTINKI